MSSIAARPQTIQQIHRFILDLSRDPAIAEAFVARIIDRCRRIGATPHGGTPRDDLEPGLQTVSFERRAVIAYRLTEFGAEIVNVFYGGRDFEAIYRGLNPDPQA